ncbi:hypothetical protein TNCV_5070801 [Trichonephila clavipes]|nr:hypothetical protein TNCV_5070801 [Trichonephila clavipes]
MPSLSDIHRVQYIGVGGRHISWHGCKMGRPCQKPRQVSGGVAQRILSCGEAKAGNNHGSLQVSRDRIHSGQGLP